MTGEAAVEGQPLSSASWPYFLRCEHFCSMPRAQLRQRPQDAVTDQTTRSPMFTCAPPK